MEENPHKHLINKRILILVMGLVVVIAAATGGIMLLRTDPTPKPTQMEPAATPVSDVINGLKTAGAIKAFEGYQEQASDKPNGRITGALDGKNYAVSISTKHALLFFAKAQGQQNDSNAVEQQLTSYMAEKGFTKTETTGNLQKSENPKYQTYKSSAGICQLTSAQPFTQEGLAYHAISCAENNTMTQEYTTIESLLDLYKKERTIPAFTEVSRITTAEENKTMSFLSLSQEGRSTSLLLFAAIDNNWEYIGNVDGGTSSNGKYAISEEMRNKIDDSRWGDFLKKNLR